MMTDSQTTLGQLEIELAKLGVTTMSWSATGANHAIVLTIEETRIIGYGSTMINALNDAINRLATYIFADVIVYHRRSRM